MYQDQPRDSMVVVENLRVFTDVKSLKQPFSSYGVKQIWLHACMFYKDSTRDAHILFHTPAAARRAVEQQNGKMFNERPMRLKMMTENDQVFSKDFDKRRAISIGNISSEATDEDLMNYFTEEVGQIEIMHRILKQDVVVIQFAKSAKLRNCFALDGTEFKGKILRMKHWNPLNLLVREKKIKKRLSSDIAVKKGPRHLTMEEREINVQKMLTKTGMTRMEFFKIYAFRDNGTFRRRNDIYKTNKKRRKIMREKADKVASILDRIV